MSVLGDIKLLWKLYLETVNPLLIDIPDEGRVPAKTQLTLEKLAIEVAKDLNTSVGVVNCAIDHFLDSGVLELDCHMNISVAPDSSESNRALFLNGYFSDRIAKGERPDYGYRKARSIRRAEELNEKFSYIKPRTDMPSPEKYFGLPELK